jgi:hypothetical protein
MIIAAVKATSALVKDEARAPFFPRAREFRTEKRNGSRVSGALHVYRATESALLPDNSLINRVSFGGTEKNGEEAFNRPMKPDELRECFISSLNSVEFRF